MRLITPEQALAEGWFVPNPSGLCMCGCGEETSLPNRTNRAMGYVNGQHVHFCPGHQNRGRKQTAEHRAKAAATRVGSKRSLETRLKMSEAQRGEKSHFWKGGITAEHELIRSSIEYAEWRRQVYERDDYTCQRCGSQRGGTFNAHHIKGFATYPELRFEVSNGATLCADPCHATVRQWWPTEEVN